MIIRRRSTSGLIHYVNLKNLKPATTYYYTIGDPSDATSLCAADLPVVLHTSLLHGDLRTVTFGEAVR